jgi:hypothetical protein
MVKIVKVNRVGTFAVFSFVLSLFFVLVVITNRFGIAPSFWQVASLVPEAAWFLVPQFVILLLILNEVE